MLTLQCFHIGVWHILMCADVYPIVALKCVLRIRRYQIPHETHFFLHHLAARLITFHRKNFRFSSILTLQCFHMLRLIFMWTFMSSCSRVQTTHAARLPSRLICPLGIWSAELVALWLWVGLPNGQLKKCKTTWSRKNARSDPLWSHDHNTWCPGHDGNLPVSLKTCNEVLRITWDFSRIPRGFPGHAVEVAKPDGGHTCFPSRKKADHHEFGAKLWIWSLVRAMNSWRSRRALM